MSDAEIIKQIISRIEKLEEAVYVSKPVMKKGIKPITLPELARHKKLSNGQERITIIVGYNEKILGKNGISEKEIQEGWRGGKFKGTYFHELLRRTLKDGLIRDLKDGTYDLSQTGENLFSSFNNS